MTDDMQTDRITVAIIRRRGWGVEGGAALTQNAMKRPAPRVVTPPMTTVTPIVFAESAIRSCRELWVDSTYL